MDEVYAQAEREERPKSSIEQSIRPCCRQEDEEIQSFFTAVEEAENRSARLNGIRSRQDGADSDEE